MASKFTCVGKFVFTGEGNIQKDSYREDNNIKAKNVFTKLCSKTSCELDTVLPITRTHFQHKEEHFVYIFKDFSEDFTPYRIYTFLATGECLGSIKRAQFESEVKLDIVLRTVNSSRSWIEGGGTDPEISEREGQRNMK